VISILPFLKGSGLHALRWCTQVVSGKREEDTARSRLQAELQRLRRKVEEEQATAAARARQATEAVVAAGRMQTALGQASLTC